ncbi:endonuclease/exonuclease/phosphatase family protein [Candidatus Saccharibacteria bacterium]|nr:endonuclease/exonuclease/phosphatase family protein [Candidatus Saccharibacteria bacterium]
MQLKTITWNIGGGKHLKDGEDLLLMASYSVDAIAEIAEWLKANSPDIITVQEAQGDGDTNQVEEIAKLLGYSHYFFDPTSSSHIDDNKTLGNGIISKYPIADHSTGLFINPNIETTIQGRHAVSHDKGYGTCIVSFDRYDISVTTLHLLPFQAFDVDFESEIGKEILHSIESVILPKAPMALIQGDFNIDSPQLTSILPDLLANMDEISLNEPTTPSGRRYDHVLYKGLVLESMEIDSTVKTDHYPVICEFSIAT